MKTGLHPPAEGSGLAECTVKYKRKLAKLRDTCCKRRLCIPKSDSETVGHWGNYIARIGPELKPAINLPPSQTRTKLEKDPYMDCCPSKRGYIGFHVSLGEGTSHTVNPARNPLDGCQSSSSRAYPRYLHKARVGG